MLIHCTMEELLSVRDGEGSRAALLHLDDCEECRDELDRLHQRVAALKAMPTLHPPRDRWSNVRDQVLADRARKRRHMAQWISLAAAASLALAVGATRIIPAMTASEPEEMVGLVEQADELQGLLKVLEPRTRVVNGRVATAIAEIEDRLSVVDSRLAEVRALPAELPRDEMSLLLRQRVELLDALVRMHTTNSTYIGF
jgi:hypothetical protein